MASVEQLRLALDIGVVALAGFLGERRSWQQAALRSLVLSCAPTKAVE
jgi:hypothetical protein